MAKANYPVVRDLTIPSRRIVERKIGRSTFIVSSRFNESKEKDIVSTVARLIQYDNDMKG